MQGEKGFALLGICFSSSIAFFTFGKKVVWRESETPAYTDSAASISSREDAEDGKSNYEPRARLGHRCNMRGKCKIRAWTNPEAR